MGRYKSNCLINEKNARAISICDKMVLSDISRSLIIDYKYKTATFSHLTKVFLNFEHEGLITKEKNGRTNIISLTDKGKKYVKCLKVMMDE